MGFFDWFKRRVQPPAEAAPPPAPEVLEPDTPWRVGCGDDDVWMIDPEGVRRSVAFADLFAIAIEASDTGTAGLDVWWLFYGEDEDLAFSAPLGASGQGAMIARLSTLPGFRHDRLAEATESSDVDTFVLWQRPFD